jgi:nucleoside-diphosphate-sugar epimerase
MHTSVIASEAELDELLTEPRAELVEFVRTVSSPLMVLGASGKMGPTLAVLAKRAAQQAGVDLDVVGVARFGDVAARDWLEARGVRTITYDLLDRAQVDALPDARDVMYMAGRKFGTSDDPTLTWSMNTIAPVNALERYRDARISALSTGTVYDLASVESGGSRESDPPAPIGEYANACLARERIFEYYARHHGTRVCLVRLNYAVEMRYGVIVDIAQKVWAGLPVDVTMGYFNCIWQRDANEYALRALDLASAPAGILNLTGSQTMRVRDVALRLGELMNRPVTIVGAESDRAYLNDARRAIELFGEPPVEIDDVIAWTADWIARGGVTLGKPTHFEVSDGKY